jgi:hypothetical protein
VLKFKKNNSGAKRLSIKSVSEHVAKDLTGKPKNASTIKQACQFHVVEKALGRFLTSFSPIITCSEVRQ